MIKTDHLFTLVLTNFEPPTKTLPAIMHFCLSEPLTPLRGTQFENHCFKAWCNALDVRC